MIVLFGIDRDLSQELTALVEDTNVVVDNVETDVSRAVVIAHAYVEQATFVAKRGLDIVVDEVPSDAVARLVDQRVGNGLVA